MIRKLAFFLMLSCFSLPVSAQLEPEDIAAVTDDFQDAFYESLTQKGIENYDRALIALEKCKQLQPDNVAVYHELGKNYLLLKDYDKAYKSFEKAFELDPSNMWPLAGMYDVCYETQDYVKAIEIVQRLVEFRKEYREELTSLYMMTHQFDKALDLINELNDKVGKSDMRDGYKAQILRDPKYQGVERANLLEQIAKNPKVEDNYINLIFLYYDSDQDDKALEIAKKLEREIPSSDWAQVSMYKFHIQEGSADKAINSLTKVFASKKIDNKIKHRMLNEFLIFAKDKPQYDDELEKAIGYFDSERQIQISKEVGKFYHEKQRWDRALRYYDSQLRSNPTDMETAMLRLEVYEKTAQFDLLSRASAELVEIFPLQPHFYYFAGLGYNGLKDYKKSKDMLEMGLDYVVDDPTLESNFYRQLGHAYEGLGDVKKRDTAIIKAESLSKNKDK